MSAATQILGCGPINIQSSGGQLCSQGIFPNFTVKKIAVEFISSFNSYGSKNIIFYITKNDVEIFRFSITLNNQHFGRIYVNTGDLVFGANDILNLYCLIPANYSNWGACFMSGIILNTTYTIVGSSFTNVISFPTSLEFVGPFDIIPSGTYTQMFMILFTGCPTYSCHHYGAKNNNSWVLTKDKAAIAGLMYATSAYENGISLTFNGTTDFFNNAAQVQMQTLQYGWMSGWLVKS